jgi:hypothetical protein
MNAQHRARCLIQGCYYGLATQSDVCVYCGAPRPSNAPLMGESPLQTLGRPYKCYCGHEREAHNYYTTGRVFTDCRACSCEGYEPERPA